MSNSVLKIEETVDTWEIWDEPSRELSAVNIPQNLKKKLEKILLRQNDPNNNNCPPIIYGENLSRPKVLYKAAKDMKITSRPLNGLDCLNATKIGEELLGLDQEIMTEYKSLYQGKFDEELKRWQEEENKDKSEETNQ